jgi:ribA/ribD-fused uncharacterized protein
MTAPIDVFFYGKLGLYGFLSNMFYCNFKEGKVTFNCGQQYLSYCKIMMFDPINHSLKLDILNEKNPLKIKYYGRQVRNFDSDKWEHHQYKIMRDGLILKFQQNNSIRDKLLNDDHNLYFASKDRNWGIGYTESSLTLNKHLFGKNKLGLCLMDVRKLIR